MLNAGDFLAVLAFVGPRNLVPNELFAGVRMLAFCQSGEVFILDRAAETPAFCEPALPFTENALVAAPVVLLVGGKFLLVVGPRLAG